MNINEIFYSIQGEGKWTGLPNIFIRVTGCNLRCGFCDTKYAYVDREEKDIKEICQGIKKYKCKKICITGGEPLLQKDIFELIDLLIKKGYEMIIETNGSIKVDGLLGKKNLFISMDIKCPSSKMNDKMNFENIKKLQPNDQLKFIIADKKDYDFARKIFVKYKPICNVFFQPAWGTDTKLLTDWILDDNLNVKLGLQLHKIIWGEGRGF